MDDRNIEEKMADVQSEAKAIHDAEESKEEAVNEKKKKLAIKKQVKHKVIMILAVIGGLILVWQKLHIWIVIPGTFWHLLLIIGAVIGAIYLVLNKLTED